MLYNYKNQYSFLRNHSDDPSLEYTCYNLNNDELFQAKINKIKCIKVTLKLLHFLQYVIFVFSFNIRFKEAFFIYILNLSLVSIRCLICISFYSFSDSRISSSIVDNILTT